MIVIIVPYYVKTISLLFLIVVLCMFELRFEPIFLFLNFSP